MHCLWVRNIGFCLFSLFREFRFTSEVPIWLDYQGKHVAIEQVRVQTLGDWVISIHNIVGNVSETV